MIVMTHYDVQTVAISVAPMSVAQPKHNQDLAHPENADKLVLLTARGCLPKIGKCPIALTVQRCA